MSSAAHGIFFLSVNRNLQAGDTAEVQPLLQRNSEGRGAGGSTQSSTWALVSHTWTCFLQPLQLLCHSVQFSPSVVSDALQPHELQHTRPPCPSPTLKLMSIKSVMPSNHLILCRPLLLLPSISPSIRIFSNESVFHIRWPKY